MKFLSKSKILNNRKNLKEFNPCIYFLIDRGEIVYIRQTTQINARISEHINYKNRKDEQKIFDSFYSFDCEIKNLDKYESEYIMKFQPKYNQQLPSSVFISMLHIKRIYDIDLTTINIIVKQYNLIVYNFRHKEYIKKSKFNKVFTDYIKGKKRIPLNYLECKF